MSFIDPHDELLPPPPPAYSEEEFDRKISTTVQLSLNAPPDDDDDEWEVWDEAAFEAAARALAAGGGSSSATQAQSSVEPLKIKKKGFELDTSSKPRPSWLSQAESAPQDAGTSQHGNAISAMPDIVHQLPDEEDDDHLSQPPPAFTASAPSLDGPPYEQVVSPPWVEDGSSTASPLHSPTLPPQPLAIPPQIPPPQVEISPPQEDLRYRIPRHTLPPPQSTHHAVPQRPVSEYPKPSPVPSSFFDHSLAYNQASNYGLSQAERNHSPPSLATADYAYNAASFYNSAVATHLRTRPPPNNFSHHMPSQPRYYNATSNHPTQRPCDSGSYGRGSVAPARSSPAPRFPQYGQYTGSTMMPHLPR